MRRSCPDLTPTILTVRIITTKATKITTYTNICAIMLWEFFNKLFQLKTIHPLWNDYYVMVLCMYSEGNVPFNSKLCTPFEPNVS